MDPSALKELPREVLSRVLKSLSYREREILKLIAGVGDGFRYTSEEVAHIFKVSPTEIDAVVRRAMEKARLRLESMSSESSAPQARASGIDITIVTPEYCEEQAIVEKLVELCLALNDMHVSAGGTGLVINDDRTFSGVSTLEGVPAQ